MLYADDVGVVSISPRGLPRIIDVIAVACQEFGLIVSKKKTEAMLLRFDLRTASNALRIEVQANGINRQPSLCIMVVLSARAHTSKQRLSVAPAPLERVSEGTVPNCTTDRTPGCRSRSSYSKWR